MATKLPDLALLGDIAPFAYGRALPERDRDASGTVPVYGSNGVVGTHTESLTDGPTVIIGRKGTVGAVHYSPNPCWPIDTTFYVQGTDEYPARYLYYLLTSVGLSDMNSDSAVPGLNRGAAHALQVRVPPTQHGRERIAHILGTLDDKIDLNRRMSQTLEDMARALFKSWFVDFDPVRAKAEGRDTVLPTHLADLFPDSFVDSELGEIPEGWRVRRVEDIAKKVAMGPFGSNIRVETFSADGVPVISGQHLRGITLEDSSFNFVTEEHAELLAGANVQRGDIVFTHAGSIGQAAYIPETSQYDKYVISQRQFYLRCDRSVATPEFIALFFNSREGRHRLLANTSSSGVPSIARPVSYLRTIPITVPPLPVLLAFNEIVRPLLAAQEIRKGANRTLVQLRDRLMRELVGATGGSHD